jgi:hypothetical protein
VISKESGVGIMPVIPALGRREARGPISKKKKKNQTETKTKKTPSKQNRTKKSAPRPNKKTSQ